MTNAMQENRPESSGRFFGVQTDTLDPGDGTGEAPAACEIAHYSIFGPHRDFIGASTFRISPQFLPKLPRAFFRLSDIRLTNRTIVIGAECGVLDLQ